MCVHMGLEGCYAPCRTNKEKETHLLVLNRFIRHLLSATCGERSWRTMQSAQQLWPSPGCSSRRTRSRGQQTGFGRETRRKVCDVQGGLDSQRGFPRVGRAGQARCAAGVREKDPKRGCTGRCRLANSCGLKSVRADGEPQVLKAEAGVGGLCSWVFILMLTGRHRAADRVGPPSGRHADKRPGHAGLPLIQPSRPSS